MKAYCSFLALLLLLGMTAGASAERPNILWLFAEDTSPWMGCYGDPVNVGQTPNIDSLAANGVLFSRAYVPAPVCSACRSAMMGGQSQIRFNAHEHRSSRGTNEIHLPEGMKLLPQLVKESGYFTFNIGKTDYNFIWDDDATYSLQGKPRSDIPWETFKNNQPFFGQIQTAGGKSKTTNIAPERKTDPAIVTVPPDYPQNQLYREVVAQHYDAIRTDDDLIGTYLQGLKEAGLAENTIVIYFGDHGANHLVRHKQMPTEGGLHVPFVISGPEEYIPSGVVRNDLVNLLDLSTTTLRWARVDKPDWYEGRDLFPATAQPRQFVASAKDRLDHTIDRVRTLRTDRFRYTRNYKTDRIFLQPQYRDVQPYLRNLRELYASGELSPKLTEIYFGERPAEELYDAEDDPAQVNNLIDDPAYAEEVERHRKLLNAWVAKGDLGEGEEPAGELAMQTKSKKWRSVNPEYEAIRNDSDGDGLSDEWEAMNDRDPADGRLLFTFDCGGWQTEGWEAPESFGNIAGRQGYLDFRIPEGGGTLVRKGMKLDSDRNRGVLEVVLRVSEPVELIVSSASDASDARLLGSVEAEPKDEFVTCTLPLAKNWDGTVNELQIRVDGASGTLVEIDSISVLLDNIE